jgi:hypothetical protein
MEQVASRAFEETFCHHLQDREIGQARNPARLCSSPAFALVSCVAYSPAVKMQAICSFQTSVDTQRTTRPYIPEDGTLHNHRENLKSYIPYCLLVHFPILNTSPGIPFPAGVRFSLLHSVQTGSGAHPASID